jgi:Family of unknown function (DUF5908)
MGGFEIRELIIKATIVPETGGESAGSVGALTSRANDTSPNEELIKTCVERVMEILKDKDER